MSKVKELINHYRDILVNGYEDTPTFGEIIGDINSALAKDVAEIERLLDEEIEWFKFETTVDSTDNFRCGLYSGTLNGLEKLKPILSKVLK